MNEQQLAVTALTAAAAGAAGVAGAAVARRVGGLVLDYGRSAIEFARDFREFLRSRRSRK
jgi:hypothetical protein